MARFERALAAWILVLAMVPGCAIKNPGYCAALPYAAMPSNGESTRYSNRMVSRRYLLDTNVLSEPTRGLPSQHGAWSLEALQRFLGNLFHCLA